MRAQRRPGREPRRHLVRSHEGRRLEVAQRRPGREPRRHALDAPAPLQVAAVRSTKAGARTPATPPVRRGWRRPSASLNEGRGANPGDTRVRPADISSRRRAQRRPGREPRRHRPAARAGRPERARSTKAGARTPATLHEVRRLVDDERRSTKAGARTPATRGRTVGGSGADAALNEGRGANPGDTPRVVPLPVRSKPAQRRPGREPRRHPSGGRRPHHDHVDRSTKAGARTPATRTTPGRVSSGTATAQRRPGREPRRHLAWVGPCAQG